MRNLIYIMALLLSGVAFKTEAQTLAQSKPIQKLQKQAYNGDIQAQAVLADKYYQANDVHNAFVWFKRAAEQGEETAQYNLAMMYYKGLGTSKDLGQAFKWYEVCAKNGNSDAQYNIGMMARYGKGGTQDYPTAIKWLSKSAQNGNSEAQFELGIMYFDGEGVEKNVDKSKFWLQESIKNGNQSAKEFWEEENLNQ